MRPKQKSLDHLAYSSCLLFGTMWVSVGCSVEKSAGEASVDNGLAAETSPNQPLEAADFPRRDPAEPIASEIGDSLARDGRLAPAQRSHQSPTLAAPRPIDPASDERTDRGRFNPGLAGSVNAPGEAMDLAEPVPAPLEPVWSDLTPDELVRFLGGADADMELIHSGRSGIDDPRQARKTLVQIVDRKLQAARTLVAHPDASANQQSEGRRGELQALSHLAALSDVGAAQELEALAKSNMQSDDPRLVADSRLVLIGFAIEDLQNGKPAAAEKIVEYIRQISNSDSPADVPALIVMGQAKQMLESFGHPDLAGQVRDNIVTTFADSENPDVAKMAAQFAGNLSDDSVDQLRTAILAGGDETVVVWADAVASLIDQSADIQTVRYLAGAAVDFEANGLIEFADTTLQLLQSRFRDPDAATTREVETAVEATEARQRILGLSFNPDLPVVHPSDADRSNLNLEDFHGKVVLMPFWGIGIPLSLQSIPILQEIRDQNPDSVAIVGVNIDPEDAPVNEFLAANHIKFPSFRLSADPESTIPRDFGMVSMPFVVILDRDGQVAAIQLSDRNLKPTIERLIAGR